MTCIEAEITLRGVEPKVKRIIRIPWEYTYHELHNLIQTAFSWMNTHLYVFRQKNPEAEVISDREVYNLYLYNKDKQKSSAFDGTVDINKLFTGNTLLSYDTPVKNYIHEFTSIIYTYDLGDCWIHDIKINGITEAKGPEVIYAEGIVPPEDSGGAAGYSKIREALYNKEHRDHKNTLEWAKTKGFTGKNFDINELNKIISKTSLKKDFFLEDKH